MFQLNSPDFHFRVRSTGQRKLIYDIIRRKYVALTPEEWVRQHVIHYFTAVLQYPQGVISVERMLELNGLVKRTDIVVYGPGGQPLLIVECKSPDVKLSQLVFDQAAMYNMQLQVPYLVVTNGLQHFVCRVDLANKKYEFLDEVPAWPVLIT